MNNLKFKVWDKEKKEWVDCDGLYIDSNGNIFEFIDEYGESFMLEHVDLKVFQSTGQKDINKKELYYDSDIIENVNKGKKYIIRKDDFDVPYLWDGKDRVYGCIDTVIEFKIIGNLQENPELWGVK